MRARTGASDASVNVSTLLDESSVRADLTALRAALYQGLFRL